MSGWSIAPVSAAPPQDSSLQHAPEILEVSSWWPWLQGGHCRLKKLWGCPLVPSFPAVSSANWTLPRNPLLSFHRNPFVWDNGTALAQDNAAEGFLECLETGWMDIVSQYFLLPGVAFELVLNHLLCISSLGEQSERGWEKCFYSP